VVAVLAVVAPWDAQADHLLFLLEPFFHPKREVLQVQVIAMVVQAVMGFNLYLTYFIFMVAQVAAAVLIIMPQALVAVLVERAVMGVGVVVVVAAPKAETQFVVLADVVETDWL
jgi:hypothetical protein